VHYCRLLVILRCRLNICFAAEVGLSGELRGVSRIEQRITEAEKLGFDTIYISKHNMKSLNVAKYKIEIKAAGKMEQIYKELFAEG
jgi:DNA repair protein RadA/Sms